MKKTFRARHNALLSPRTLSIGTGALAVALLLAALRLIAPGAFVSIVAPIAAFGARASATAGALTAGFRDSAKLAASLAALGRENAALALKNRILTEKASDLEKLIGREPAIPDGIIAGVLLGPPVAAYDTLLVGAGLDDGVAVGMKVFAGDVPVGRVASATAHSARVVLLSSPGQTFSGWVGKKRVPAEVEGRGGGAMSAVVPKDAEVGEGDIVFAPGPGALPVGTVVRVVRDSSAPSAALAIAGSVNVFSLVWVVIRP